MCHDGIISKSDITDMGDILLGNASGRDSDDQIIVYSELYIINYHLTFFFEKICLHIKCTWSNNKRSRLYPL